MDDDSTLVLAATDRLARSLREDYALKQRQAGHHVWRTPHIASLRQRVADVWTDTWPAEQLISGTQALALWLDAIEQDDTPLLAPLACAREALRAERLLLAWRIDTQSLPSWTDEQRAWLRWRERVRHRMQRQGWLLREDLEAIVSDGLRDGLLPTPPSVELYGFPADPSPSVDALLAALAERTTVTTAASPPSGTAIHRYRSPDLGQQFRHVAALIRERLQFADPQAPPRIVVVLPDPQAQRGLLEPALIDLVAPWRHDPLSSIGVPWRWDDGRPLTAWPWVEAAAAVFALDLENNPIDVVSRLLLSPILWQDNARADAAALDYRLRDMGRSRLRLADISRFANGSAVAPLQRLLKAVQAEPRRARPSAWTATLQARLDALGWPGAAALSSEAFQTVRELRQRLARLAGMDAMLGAVDCSRARQWLAEFLHAGFEPRVEHHQPVTITSPDDAAELSCDLMIVCNADADTFPGHARATPFLALEAQRAAGIPEASPGTLLDQARDRVAALMRNAAEVQVLFPAVNASGAENLPSLLFGDDWQDAPTAMPAGVAERLAAMPTPLTTPDHDRVPPVAEAEAVAGDASLFTVWAESPFFALCTHRLGIQPLPCPGHGLDARTQGTILHKALERFWETRRTRAELLALDTNALDQAIAEALNPALARWLPERDIGRIMARLEAARLHDVLRQWLRHEARRTDPFEVVAREEPLQADLAGLPLRLRIDRIDRVDTATGPRWLVLDYKTGREAKPGGWNADRLREPQLPLYATLVTAGALDAAIIQVDGIGFAHLKDGHPALSAATDWCHSLIEADTEPKRNWKERIAAWSICLDGIARAFLAGEAGFDATSASLNGYHKPLLALTGSVVDEEIDDGVGDSE